MSVVVCTSRLVFVVLLLLMGCAISIHTPQTYHEAHSNRLSLDRQQKIDTYKKLTRESELIDGYNSHWSRKLSKSEKKMKSYERVRRYCIDVVKLGCTWAEANALLENILKQAGDEQQSRSRSKTTEEYRHLMETWMLPTNVLSKSYPAAFNTRCKRLKRFPTALEFVRDYISKSTPFIVEGGVSSWPAVGKWGLRYLNETAGGQPIKLYTSLDRDFEKIQSYGEWRNKSLSKVNMRSDPATGADIAGSSSSSSSVQDDELIMIRPAETAFTFAQYMYLASYYPNLEGATFYLQKHDMRRWQQLDTIVRDISPSIFGSKAVEIKEEVDKRQRNGKYKDKLTPDRKRRSKKSKSRSASASASASFGANASGMDYMTTNGFGFAHFLPLEHFFMWAGTTDTRGPVHYDENENIFSMVRGSKTFELFHPLESDAMYETMAKFRSGHLLFDIDLEGRELNGDHDDDDNDVAAPEGQYWTVPVSSTDFTYQPFSPVNISHPDYTMHPNFRRARKVTCTVNTGDVLYLPSNWWHEVSTHPPQKLNTADEGEDDVPMTIGINIFFQPYWKKASDFKHYSRTPHYDHLNRFMPVDREVVDEMLRRGSVDPTLDPQKEFLYEEDGLRDALRHDYWQQEYEHEHVARKRDRALSSSKSRSSSSSSSSSSHSNSKRDRGRSGQDGKRGKRRRVAEADHNHVDDADDAEHDDDSEPAASILTSKSRKQRPVKEKSNTKTNNEFGKTKGKSKADGDRVGRTTKKSNKTSKRKMKSKNK